MSDLAIDDDLLGDDDELDYDIENEDEEALLADEPGILNAPKEKDIEEDVLDLDVDVELEPENEQSETGSEKVIKEEKQTSSQDTEDLNEEKKLPKSKFVKERLGINENTTKYNQSRNNRFSQRGNFNQRGRGIRRGGFPRRGGGGFNNHPGPPNQRLQEKKTVLINPHFRGNVQANPQTRLAWDHHANPQTSQQYMPPQHPVQQFSHPRPPFSYSGNSGPPPSQMQANWNPNFGQPQMMYGNPRPNQPIYVNPNFNGQQQQQQQQMVPYQAPGPMPPNQSMPPQPQPGFHQSGPYPYEQPHVLSNQRQVFIDHNQPNIPMVQVQSSPLSNQFIQQPMYAEQPQTQPFQQPYTHPYQQPQNQQFGLNANQPPPNESYLPYNDHHPPYQNRPQHPMQHHQNLPMRNMGMDLHPRQMQPKPFRKPLHSPKMQYQPQQQLSPQPRRRPFENASPTTEKRKKRSSDLKNLHEVTTIDLSNREKNVQVDPIPEDEDEETKAYRLKIEEQKRKREEILRLKEERRKLAALKADQANILPTPQELAKSISPNTLPNQQQQQQQQRSVQLRKPQQLLQKSIVNPQRTVVRRPPANTPQQVLPASRAAINTKNIVPIRRIVLTQPAESATPTPSPSEKQHLEAFLSNRTVVNNVADPVTQIKTPMVTVSNLAAGTTETKIRKMCQGIGAVQILKKLISVHYEKQDSDGPKPEQMVKVSVRKGILL